MQEGFIMKKRLIEIATLEIDAKIGKDRHFIAARQKNALRIFLGLLAVIGSAFIASGIIEYIVDILIIPDWAKVANRIVPLIVGISTAMLSFLGLEKEITQHRSIGNRYIEVARKARQLLNSITKDVQFSEIEQKYSSLLDLYLVINQDGESCPTSEKHSKKALKQNENKRKKFKELANKMDDSLFAESN